MFKQCLFLYILLSIFTQLNAVNHWIVTQSGKIQAFLDSPFDLRKPDDLLALLDQENRKNDINDLYEELLTRKNAIEKKWLNIEKNSNVGSKVTSEDVDCIAADTLFSDLDLYNNIAINGTERGITITVPKKVNMEKDKVKSSKEYKVPTCMNLTPEKWSESLVNKTNLVLKPEESLRKTFLPMKSLDQFGYYIVKSLRENSTSWVHYNLASFYWRIKGEGDKAIDCLKLAIQFVRGNFQDIPLHNLAGILHQSRHSKEAIQILNSAIQFAPKEPKHYFAMANIYAALRDFNSSVVYYEKLLELDPNNKEAANHRHAVLCYHKLETALTTFQNDLQSILFELHDYHSIQQQWLRLQERLMWETASFDYQYDAVGPEILDAPKKVQRCLKRTTGGKPMISCDFYEKTPEMDKLNLHSLFQIVENEKHKFISHPLNLRLSSIQDDYGKSKPADHMLRVGFPKFPTSMPTKGNQYFDVTGWPRKEECMEWNLPIEEKEDLHLPLFLPPENKGYMLKKALTDELNLPEGSQHELPWYPPVCEGDNIDGEKFLPVSQEKHNFDVEQKPSEFLKKELLKYVSDGAADEHEIGQRIISAMEKRTAPKWVLASLASLYWRVRANIRKALDCLDLAFQNAPKEHTDVVLVSLGSTMYLLGLKEQSLKFASLAFKINYIEPSTNFLLALLHYENNNPLLAMYYLKNTLRVDSNFYDGLGEKLLKIWSCRIKLGVGPKLTRPIQEDKQPHCFQSESKSEFCNAGNDCKTDNIQCFTSERQVVIDSGAIRASEIYEHCKDKTIKSLGEQIMASLAAAETREDEDLPEFNEIKLKDSGNGFYYPHVHHHVHMGLSLGAEHFLQDYNKVGDFYVSLDINDNPGNERRLHIYDKYGTYTLSSKLCQYGNLLGSFKYSQLWEFVKDKMFDISSYLKQPTNKNSKEIAKPQCMQVVNPHMPFGLNELTLKVLALELPNVQDRDLTELLQLVCSSSKLNIRELGTKIAKALAKDETDWQFLMASAIYWITVGNTEEAVVCIRGVVTKVPIGHLDIPLMFLSHLLWNTGLQEESLKIAHLGLKQNPSNILNHFRVAEIYIRLDKYEEAVPYLRASLLLDDRFDVARIRLKAVLCKLLFEDGYLHGGITAKIVDN
ncbi:tetratricopeptide repeat protein 17 [Euwallacea similis]|uniref:tetratricopeptide repeat protein 17 n=1 Tax=Euwallacea similis TaxID=1736056 RepID=UPI00344F0E08